MEIPKELVTKRNKAVDERDRWHTQANHKLLLRECWNAGYNERKNMKQKVRIGSIVIVANPSGRQCAAIVTAVHSEDCINVTRFECGGDIKLVTSLVKVADAPKGTLDWNWPPV